MAGFTGTNDLISEVTQNGKVYPRTGFKNVTSPEAAGVWHSLWRETGMPGVGADPATTPGTSYSSSAGGLYFPDQASDYKFLANMMTTLTQVGTVMIYDRLVAVSGISVASTGNKTISSTSLPRYTNGIGVQCWLEFSTASTATVGSITLNSYTDTDDNTGQTGAAVSMPAAATNVNSFVQLPLAAGDLGLKAVSTINVGTATTSGVVNVVLLYPLGYVPHAANVATIMDFVTGLPIMPRLYDGATLGLAVLAANTTTARHDFIVNVVYG